MPRLAPLALAAGLALSLIATLPLSAQSSEDARQAYLAGDYTRAAEIARPLADAGDPAALNLMASLYEEGEGGLPLDTARAIALFAQAAELGSAAAQNNLGRIYHFGLHGQAVDPLRAEALYQQSIASGSEFAQNNYALLQEDGLLGPQDWPRIISLYSQAANRDEPNAAANLSNIYLNGRDGVAADPVLARQWAERSVAVGSTRGMRMLGYMLEFAIGGANDTQRALTLYRQAHDLGDRDAANDLGLIYRYGAEGLPADPGLAMAWFELGISQGDPWAHVNMADLLSDGDALVPDDPIRARRLYQVAHDAGNLEASVSLAYLHWDGIGGPVDYATARSLLIHASEAGNVGAMNDLGVMLAQGLGGEVDVFGAAHLYRRAAEGGHALGAQNLAYILVDTAKEPADPVEGLAWCHFSVDRAVDRATQLEYRQNCTDLAVTFSEADRRAAITRSLELLSQF